MNDRARSEPGGEIIPLPANGASADISIRVLSTMAMWLEDQRGLETLERVAAKIGLSPLDFRANKRWLSCEQFDAFLTEVRALVPDEASFREAAAYRLADSYGPLRYVLWAGSPRSVLELGIKNMSLVSSVSGYEITSSSRTHIHTLYKNRRFETRLMCLSRQAQTAAMPTLWGLPPAHIEELSCIARGDPYCEWHTRWLDQRRLGPVLAGLGAGGAGAIVTAQAIGIPLLALAALPALGAALGYAYELARTNQSNLRVGHEINEVLRQLARETAEANRELLEIHRRHELWSHNMQAEVRDKNAALAEINERVQRMREVHKTTLRGFSHDLKNPLSVLKIATKVLRDNGPRLAPEAAVLIEEHERAVAQMERLLAELTQVTAAEGGQLEASPKAIETAELTERLRRRMRALVHGQDIRVSVFATREAPDRIEVDELLLDRVVDNLLSNAAKYTERGSILIEVSGTPGFLTLKISDTGRGIPQEDIERIFKAGGSDEKMRAPASWGVGLSVVVFLLGQIGGRLEVMSKPEQGTTFWAHFPERMPRMPIHTPKSGSPSPDMFGKVVTIRRT